MKIKKQGIAQEKTEDVCSECKGTGRKRKPEWKYKTTENGEKIPDKKGGYKLEKYHPYCSRCKGFGMVGEK